MLVPKLLQISANYALRHGVLLLDIDGPNITVALREGSDKKILIELRRYLKRTLKVVILDEQDFAAEYEHQYSEKETNPQASTDIYNPPNNILKEFLSDIIAEGVAEGADTIRIECNNLSIIISSYRGQYHDIMLDFSASTFPTLSKDMMQLMETPLNEISEKDEGRLLYGEDEEAVKVQFITEMNSNIFMLDISNINNHDIQIAGLMHDSAKAFSAALKQGKGLILIAGMEKSDRDKIIEKSLLYLDNDPKHNIAISSHSIETLSQISEIYHISEDNDLSSLIRKSLVQRAKILIIDSEINRNNADTILRVAQNSQLVIVSVEQSSSVKAIQYFRDLKTDLYALSNAVNLVVTCSFVPKLCSACKQAVQSDRNTASLLGFDIGTIIFKADGCEQCKFTGTFGEVAIIEVISMNEHIRRVIFSGANEVNYSQIAYMYQPSLGAVARHHIRKGHISAEQAMDFMKIY